VSERPVGPDDLPRGFEREWTEFLDEIRVALPGVQLLFGFLLAAPFSAHFESVTGLVQDVYLVCFLATAASCIFLIAPSVYHRLHWRRNVRDKEQMLLTCNQLAIIGGVLLAIAMTTAVFVVTSIVTTPLRAVVVSGVAGILIVSLWFVLPIARRRVEQKS
jgi:tellurite resistance protein TehA-like permease